MGLPNRIKFFASANFLEWADRSIPGDPYGQLLSRTSSDEKRVMDLFGGTGYTSRPLLRSASVTVVDASPELLRKAISKAELIGASCKTVRADARELPFPDRAFDLVLCAFGLHELDSKGRERCLREVHRVLRRGGRLLIVEVDDARTWKRPFRWYLRASHRSDTHQVLGDGLKDLVTRCDFDIDEHVSGQGTVLPFQVIVATAAPTP